MRAPVGARARGAAGRRPARLPGPGAPVQSPPPPERSRRAAMTEPCDLAAVELRRLIGTKALSPVELLESCRLRIDQINPTLNAVTATCWERAEGEAKLAEATVMAGAEIGLLHGLPLGV